MGASVALDRDPFADLPIRRKPPVAIAQEGADPFGDLPIIRKPVSAATGETKRLSPALTDWSSIGDYVAGEARAAGSSLAASGRQAIENPVEAAKSLAGGIFHSIDDPLQTVGKALRYPFTRSQADVTPPAELAKALIMATALKAAGPAGEAAVDAAAPGLSRIMQLVTGKLGPEAGRAVEASARKVISRAGSGAAFMVGAEPDRPIKAAIEGAVIGPVLGTAAEKSGEMGNAVVERVKHAAPLLRASDRPAEGGPQISEKRGPPAESGAPAGAVASPATEALSTTDPFADLPVAGDLREQLAKGNKGAKLPPVREVLAAEPERITAAAVKTEKGVYTGRLHSDATTAAVKAGAGATLEEGFTTSTGRFVDRDEAYQIAEQGGQLSPDRIYRARKLDSSSLNGVVPAGEGSKVDSLPSSLTQEGVPGAEGAAAPAPESAPLEGKLSKTALPPVEPVAGTSLEVQQTAPRAPAESGKPIVAEPKDLSPALPEKSERGLFNTSRNPAGKLYKPEQMETPALLDEVLRRRQAAEKYYDFKNLQKYGPTSVVTRNNDAALARAESVLEDRDGLTREQIDNEVNARLEATGDATFNYGANAGESYYSRSGGRRGARSTPGATAHKAGPDVPVGSDAPPPVDQSTHPTPDAPGLQTSGARPVQFTAMPRAIKTLFNPMALGPKAEATGGLIRHQAAVGWRALAVANEQLRSFGNLVGKLSKLESVALWDAAEHGRSTGDPTIDAHVRTLHEVTDGFTQQLIQLDRLKAAATIDNYIGRFWEQSGRADMGMIARIFGKRPLEGPKSFLKQRSLANFTDGLDAGLVPLTYNFVDAQLAKITEMQRVINAEHMLREEKAAGRAKPIVFGQKPPVDSEGRPWPRIDTTGSDPAFTVYGPPDVTTKEAFDANVRAQLTAVIEALPNLEHERRTSVNMGGRSAAGSWGAASATGERMQTRFGGPDTVIEHELGHILDARYKLYSKLVLPGERQGIPGELRALAELRHEGQPNADVKFKNYVQKPEEQVANAIHALIYAPELMQEVAPTVKARLTSFLRSQPELAALLDIKPSLAIGEREYKTPILGITTVGHWHAPAESAAVWQNYLSRGLKGNPLVDAYMAPAQAAQQMMLGVSGFHGTVIATEAMFSELALGVQELVNRGGVRSSAPGSIIRAVKVPVSGAVVGRRIMKEFVRPGTHPELETVIDEMMKGGYRGTIESEFWTGGRMKNLKQAYADALHAESKGRQFFGMAKLPLDALWAGIELASKPILGKYVPWQKTYATYAKVAQELTRLPEGTPIEEVRRVIGDVVNEMDYRFGQVIYDNHFINNTVKHIAQMMFLAPGWTGGTIALMGRGASQAIRGLDEAGRVAWAKAGIGEDRPHRAGDTEFAGPSAAYWLSAAAGTMLINGILTKIYTGQDPHGKDFWAFRNGTTDPTGNPNRSTIPGYIMHDVRGWATHPVKLFGNKLSPLLTFMWRAARNQDYFGDEVYNPEDPAMKRAVQLGGAAVKQFGPLSLQNYLEAKKRGQSGTGQKLSNAFGITPAPRDFVRTDAQNLMAEYNARRTPGNATPEEKVAREARSGIRTALRSEGRASASQASREAIASRALTRKQADRALSSAGKNASAESFKHLTLKEAEAVFALASPQEKATWQPILTVKRRQTRPRPNAAFTH
jgi:hypothetical protein